MISPKLVAKLATNLIERLEENQVEAAGFSAGHNGPYHNPETPVRNTAHWSVTLAYLVSVVGERNLRPYLEAAAQYLRSDQARPVGKNFYHRISKKSSGKDRCNGLIGPAWTFEGLIAAGDTLEDSSLHTLAEEVFLLHPFDDEVGLWRRVEVDGSPLGYDTTFNHQLWFAACAAYVRSNQDAAIRMRINRFLDALENNLRVLPEGLISHPVARQSIKEKSRRTLNQRVANKLQSLIGAHARQELTAQQHRTKWIGYHHFNLYAFARLKNAFPEHPFWSSPMLDRSVEFILSDTCKTALKDPTNTYGYGYNAPGFEVPYALSILGNLAPQRLSAEIDYWQCTQFERTWDANTATFSRGTEDPVTLTARVYEATRALAI